MSQSPAAGRPVRGAALDLDGVLVDGMPYHFVAFDAALKTFGVDATRREVALLEGMRTREVIKRIANAHDVFPTDPQLDHAERLKRKLYSEIFEPTLMPGAQDLVDLLVERRCQIAIVTGTADASARAAVRMLRAEEHIDVIVSHDSGVPLKPHPAPFLTAVEQFSLRPENCIAIENAPAGLTSARAAGLICMAVASYLETADLADADRVFTNLVELNAWLRARPALDRSGAFLV